MMKKGVAASARIGSALPDRTQGPEWFCGAMANTRLLNRSDRHATSCHEQQGTPAASKGTNGRVKQAQKAVEG